MHLVSSLHLQTQGGRAKNSAASGTCLWSESRGWVPSTALGAVFIVTPGVRTFHLNHNCAPYTRSQQREIARKSLVSPAGLVGSEWLLIPSRSDNAAFHLHSFTPIFLPKHGLLHHAPPRTPSRPHLTPRTTHSIRLHPFAQLNPAFRTHDGQRR